VSTQGNEFRFDRSIRISEIITITLIIGTGIIGFAKLANDQAQLSLTIEKVNQTISKIENEKVDLVLYQKDMEFIKELKSSVDELTQEMRNVAIKQAFRDGQLNKE